LPKVGQISSQTGFGEDGRPKWQRLYGIGTSWNKGAFDNFSTFAVVAVLVVVGLFLVLCVLAWLTT
jgi:hypothetical protein